MSCPITTDPARAAAVLKEGGLVALPTETVYGLGADATNARAVARIFAAKQRPFFDPLIVHVARREDTVQVATRFSPAEQKLAQRFWPGPLTLILPKQPHIPELVTSGLDTVGVRIPRHPLTQQVIQQAGCPIAAPSANPFGRLSPTRAEHVQDSLGSEIDLILDGGPCAVGVESTIVQCVGDSARILRPGGLSAEEISTILPVLDTATSGSSSGPLSPGLLEHHYAPRTPITIVGGELPLPDPGARWGLLSLLPQHQPAYTAEMALTTDGDLVTAASRFFEALHALDRRQLDRILAVPFPPHGLGVAVNDRLRRAAASTSSAG